MLVAPLPALEMFRWILDERFFINMMDICSNAASGGHLQLLQLARAYDSQVFLTSTLLVMPKKVLVTLWLCGNSTSYFQAN